MNRAMLDGFAKCIEPSSSRDIFACRKLERRVRIIIDSLKHNIQMSSMEVVRSKEVIQT